MFTIRYTFTACLVENCKRLCYYIKQQTYITISQLMIYKFIVGVKLVIFPPKPVFKKYNKLLSFGACLYYNIM